MFSSSLQSNEHEHEEDEPNDNDNNNNSENRTKPLNGSVFDEYPTKCACNGLSHANQAVDEGTMLSETNNNSFAFVFGRNEVEPQQQPLQNGYNGTMTLNGTVAFGKALHGTPPGMCHHDKGKEICDKVVHFSASSSSANGSNGHSLSMPVGHSSTAAASSGYRKETEELSNLKSLAGAVSRGLVELNEVLENSKTNWHFNSIVGQLTRLSHELTSQIDQTASLYNFLVLPSHPHIPPTILIALSFITFPCVPYFLITL